MIPAYRDFSKVTEDGIAAQFGDQNNADQVTPLGRSEDTFPTKLHFMLTELARDGKESIVSWQPHGRCFLVHKKKEFLDSILPYWFQMNKFESFQRQLNLYGFRRITAGPDKGAYYHEMFLQSKLFLSRYIPRIKIKGKGPRKPGMPHTEPKFHLMTALDSQVVYPDNPVGMLPRAEAALSLDIAATGGATSSLARSPHHPNIPLSSHRMGFQEGSSRDELHDHQQGGRNHMNLGTFGSYMNCGFNLTTTARKAYPVASTRPMSLTDHAWDLLQVDLSTVAQQHRQVPPQTQIFSRIPRTQPTMLDARITLQQLLAQRGFVVDEYGSRYI